MNSKYSILKTTEPNAEGEENPLKINSIYNTCILEIRQRGTQMWEKKWKQNMNLYSVFLAYKIYIYIYKMSFGIVVRF